jgi:hypothetical protein
MSQQPSSGSTMLTMTWQRAQSHSFLSTKESCLLVVPRCIIISNASLYLLLTVIVYNVECNMFDVMLDMLSMLSPTSFHPDAGAKLQEYLATPVDPSA